MSIDVDRPSSPSSNFFWNSVSFSLLNFVYWSRLFEFIKFIPQAIGYVCLRYQKQVTLENQVWPQFPRALYAGSQLEKIIH